VIRCNNNPLKPAVISGRGQTKKEKNKVNKKERKIKERLLTKRKTVCAVYV
jgi:hypothetical protein